MISEDIRNLIVANLQQDQKVVEFNDFLKDTAIDHYCGSKTPLDQTFVVDSTYQLPKQLVMIIQDRRNTTAMGIFPEIQRIWITSGTMVYLWDYVKRTLFTYETDDKVYRVGLMKPKAGIFANTIEWVLVVNSSRYITVYGVTIAPSGDMKLDVSQRRLVQSGGVKMKSIIGHNSRILMLGNDDGHIYEMVYKLDASQDRLICHTDQGFHTYIGLSSLSSFFKSVLDVKTKSITIDNQRNVVYALSEKSTIQIICLDDGGVTFKSGPTVTDINEQFASYLFAPSKSDPMKMPSPSTLDILGSPLIPKPFDIVSVHPVSKEHTPSTHDIAFYAVTSHGCRLYFASNEPNSIITEKSAFTLAFVRFGPYENDHPSVLQVSSERLETGFQLQNDVFVAPIHGKSNKIWMTSYQQQWSHGDIKIEETSDVMEYESTIVIIGQYDYSSFSNSHAQPTTFYEHTGTPIDIPHYKLIVVTNDGTVTTYKKQRPVDLVYQSVTNDTHDTHLDLALRRFGEVQTYAMLLDVLSINSNLANTSQHLLLSLANQHPENINQALILAYTRNVAHLWKKDILRGDDKDDIYGLLVKCKDDLGKLYTLASSLCGPIYETTLDVLHSTIQIIVFTIFLKKHHMFTSGFCDVNEKICFADLISTTNGHNILKNLVNKAIRYFASTNQGQVMVSAYLINHCPTVFGGANQLALYEGDEYLAIGEYLKKATGDSTQQRQDDATVLLEKSLDKYMNNIDYIMQDARTQICDMYKTLGYYQGVVTFSMHAADHPPKVNEPTSTLSLLNNTTMTGIIRNDKVDSSHSMDGVTTILSLLDHVNGISSGSVAALLRMTLPTYSHNMILHHAIYTWLIEHDKMQLLFDEEATDTRITRYLVQFLEHDYENKPIGMDYLYKYYEHQGDQEKAAACLTTLAIDVRDITLVQRIHYLNIARTYHNNDQQTLETLYQLGLVQQIILERLLEKQNDGSNDVEVDDRLSSRLLGLDDLLKDYAEKYGLWDQVLVLMRLSGSSPENGFDYAAMKAAWSCYFSQQASKDLTDFHSRFVALGKRLYPSITTFPVYLIILMVEPYCLTHGAKEGFVIDLLLETGVPSVILEDAYDFILRNKLSTSNDHHLLQQLNYLKVSSS